MTSVEQSPPLAVARAGRSAAGAVDGPRRPGRAWMLVGICTLAALLYLWDIGSIDYGNAYYSAAVRSMTTSFSNFVFGAFDPYGVVATDKPPLSLWPQAISVAVFGYHSWSLLLPQVIEGVAAVILLHRAVRLWAGENVALLAALILAVTPVTVAVNRDNNTDSLLVLLLVAAAYTFMRSVLATDPRSRTRWLWLCALLIGCGFLTKWLEAWIIVPGLAVAYLVSTTGRVRRRVTDLLGAGVVLAVSSFWWPLLHDFWPGGTPYVTSTADGTALDVIFGYNGFGKILNVGQQNNGAGLNVPLGMVGMGGGDPEVTRMFSTEVGGQISWLLPLSLLVLAVAGAAGYRRLWFELPGDRVQRAGWLLWGTWLVVAAGIFSFVQGVWHPYYTSMLAPAVAAISAAGIPVLWRAYRDSRGRQWILLPLAIAVTAVWAVELISRDPSWHGWARRVVVGLAVVAVAGLLLGRVSAAQRRTLGRPALVLGVVAALFTPALWSVATAAEHGTNGGFPSGGPPNKAFMALLRGELPETMRIAMSRPMPPGLLPPGVQPPTVADLPTGAARGGGIGGPTLSDENRRVLDYAVRNSGGTEITLVVEGGGLAASSFIVDSDAVVIGMGGYLGADAVPSVDQLQRWVTEGRARFVLSAAPGGPRLGGVAGMGGPVQQQRVAWVQQNCALVDPATYGGTPFDPTKQLPIPSFGDEALYSCR
ncbi:MAG: glycosyltransferase family 39 protein [Micromonospora sp.]